MDAAYLVAALNAFLSEWDEKRPEQTLADLKQGIEDDEVVVWSPFGDHDLAKVAELVADMAEALERDFIARSPVTAAAPELLQSLTRMLQLVEAVSHPDTFIRQHSQWVLDAKALIAKATGAAS